MDLVGIKAAVLMSSRAKARHAGLLDVHSAWHEDMRSNETLRYVHRPRRPLVRSGFQSVHAQTGRGRSWEKTLSSSSICTDGLPRPPSIEVPSILCGVGSYVVRGTVLWANGCCPTQSATLDHIESAPHDVLGFLGRLRVVLGPPLLSWIYNQVSPRCRNAPLQI